MSSSPGRRTARARCRTSLWMERGGRGGERRVRAAAPELREGRKNACPSLFPRAPVRCLRASNALSPHKAMERVLKCRPVGVWLVGQAAAARRSRFSAPLHCAIIKKNERRRLAIATYRTPCAARTPGSRHPRAAAWVSGTPSCLAACWRPVPARTPRRSGWGRRPQHRHRATGGPTSRAAGRTATPASGQGPGSGWPPAGAAACNAWWCVVFVCERRALWGARPRGGELAAKNKNSL